MGAKEKIGMLESLLSRIRTKAAEPRAASAATSSPVTAPLTTAPPPAEIAAAIREASIDEPIAVAPPAPPTPVPATPARIVPPAPPTPMPFADAPPPLESRARLVSAQDRSAPPDDVVELDESNVVTDDAEVLVSATEEDIAESELLGESAEIEIAPPPPSSRRPIAEAEAPAIDAPKESEPRHTPPPESGKQVAALSFDDDLTGIREANKAEPAIEADLSGDAAIPLASQRPPAAVVKDEMEADLPSGGGAPGQFSADLSADLAAPISQKPSSKPPSVRLPSERAAPALAMQPEIVKPMLADAPAASFEGTSAIFKPKTFAELLDASLSL